MRKTNRTTLLERIQAEIPAFIFILLLLPASITQGQTKTNLEKFYGLIDSASAALQAKIPPETKAIRLELSLGKTYNVFENRIAEALHRGGIKLAPDTSGNAVKAVFVVDNAGVKYGSVFRKGFLGEFYSQRTINLSGNFALYTDNLPHENFNYTAIDTVRVDNISTLENASYPFTRGNALSEPLFSGLLEPAVAIGAVAVAVYLFFTVRSK